MLVSPVLGKLPRIGNRLSRSRGFDFHPERIGLTAWDWLDFGGLLVAEHIRRDDMKRLQAIELKIRNVFYDAQIFWKYGTGAPQSVSLPETDSILHVNPQDYRARKMIITNCCVRGKIPRNQRFFRMAVDELTPNTVLDIGLNYGECLLSMSYPSETSLFAFEANQKLQRYIDKSIQGHPNRDQIHCFFQLVTDKIEESDFWVNKNWSGGSTAATPDETVNAADYEKTTVSSTTVDHVIRTHSPDTETLFFKIDVEGYEYRVLLGMQQTLSSSSHAVGFIEFDLALLTRAGEDVEDFWAFLKDHFRVFAFDREHNWHDCQSKQLNDLKDLCGKSFHTDLVLVQSERADEIVQQLRDRWTQPTATLRAA